MPKNLFGVARDRGHDPVGAGLWKSGSARRSLITSSLMSG